MTLQPWMRYGISGVAGLAFGIVVAKYTLPPRVETRIEEKVVEKVKVEWRDRVVKEQGPVRVVTRTRTVPGPAGPTVEVEKIVEKEKIVTVRDSSGAGTQDIKTVEKIVKVEDARPTFAVEGLAGASIPDARFLWSANAQIRLLGPLWLGGGVVRFGEWVPVGVVRLEF